MALIHCPECQKEVSTEARTCPQCAYPNPGGQVKQNGGEFSTLMPCPDCGVRVSRHATQCPQCGCPLSPGRTPQPSKESVSPVFPPVSQTSEVTCPHCGLAYDSPKLEKSVVEKEFVQPAVAPLGDYHPPEEPVTAQPEIKNPQPSSLGTAPLTSTLEEPLSVSSLKTNFPESDVGEKRLDWEESGFQFSGGNRTFEIPGPETVPLETLESVNEKWPSKGRERKMNPLWEEMSVDEESSSTGSPSKWAISLVILVAIVLVFAASVAIWKIVGLEQF